MRGGLYVYFFCHVFPGAAEARQLIFVPLAFRFASVFRSRKCAKIPPHPLLPPPLLPLLSFSSLSVLEQLGGM